MCQINKHHDLIHNYEYTEILPSYHIHELKHRRIVLYTDIKNIKYVEFDISVLLDGTHDGERISYHDEIFHLIYNNIDAKSV